MILRYAPELLEDAVVRESLRREAAGDSLWIRDFHILSDQYYALPDMERDARFREAYALFFQQLGLSRPLERVAAECAALRPLLSEIILDRAVGAADEEADLHIETAGTRHARIRVRVARFDDLPAFEGFIRHEMRHVEDMLRPEFQYRPQARFASRPAEENLVRARLRLLWNLSAAGAVERTGRKGAATREDWGRIGAKLYPAVPQAAREKVVEKLWNSPDMAWPRLIELALRPDHLLEFAGVLEAAALHGPGALCPLCQFPTFSWADASVLPERSLTLLRAEFPRWSSPQGVCRQCADGYAARTQFASTHST